MKKRPLNASHSVLCYLAMALVAAGGHSARAQLLWNDATGPTANWSTAAGDENWLPGNVFWAQNADAVFAGTGEMIDVTTLNTVDDMTFNVNGYTITGAGAGSLFLSDDLASTITVTNAGETATIAETIANNAGGASSLTKTGLGTLVLTGANTWTGGTILGANAGTLNATTSGPILSIGTGPVSIGTGSTLYLDNTKTTNLTHTIANAMTGTGTLQMNFAAGVTARNTSMTNVNGFTGTIVLSNAGANADKWNANNVNAPGANLVIQSGSQLFPNGVGSTFNTISLAGTGNSETRGAIRITGVTLNGNLNLTGDTTLGFEGANATLTGTISPSVAGPAITTLTLGTNNSNAGGILSGVISNGAGVLAISAARGTSTLNGANTFTGKITMGAAGAGGLNVSSINSVTGGTAASSLGVPGSVADGTIDVGSGINAGTLNYTGTGETTDRVINLSGTIGGATLSQSGASGILNFTSAPTATGLGSKTLTLSGSSVGTAVLSGTLGNIFNNGATLSTTASAAFVAAATSISVASTTGIVIGATVSGTGITGGQRVTSITGTGPFTIGLSAGANAAGTSGQAITFTPVAALAKNGTGTWTLTADNSYLGNTSLTGGVLIMGHPNALGAFTADSGTQQSGTSELRLTGGIVTAAEPLRISGGGITNLGALRNFSGDNTYTGTVTMAAQSRINSDSGTLTLNNPTAVTGAFNLVVGGAGNMIISGGVTIGTGGVLKADGAGILTLAGVNTFTGASSIVSGTLKLDYATNDTSKLSDTTALTLGGGTLEISGGTHSEIVSATTLTAGSSSTVTRTNGATGVLSLNTITPGAGAVVNFTANDIATTDNLNINGILGSWATVTIGGVTEWATNFDDAPDGRIRAYNGFTDIFREGPNTIPNTPLANLRIVNGGTGGNVAFSAARTEINSLKMDAPAGASILAPMAGTDVLMIGNETGGAILQTVTSGRLQIGTMANDGDLTTGLTDNAVAAPLNVINESLTNDVVINSRIANNGTDVVSLGKAGAGRLVLNGSNTFSGNVSISGGSVQLGSATALGTNPTLTMGAGTTLDLNSNNTSAVNLAGQTTSLVTDNSAGTGITTLVLTGAGAAIAANLADGPTRDLALRVTNANGGFLLTNAANTFSGGIVLTNSAGGTRLSPGTVVAGAYGPGPITVGEAPTDKAGIYFATANQTLANPIIFNTGLGTDRLGIRVDVAGIVLSGPLTANLAPLTFSSNGTGVVTATGQITGPEGLALTPNPFDLTTARALTVTLSNPAGTNDYAGNTTIGLNPLAFKSTTLTLGAADQIPNGIGKGDVIINSITGTTNGVGRLNLGGFSDTINGLSGTTLSIVDGVSGTPTLTIGDGDATATYNGTITDTAGALALTKIGLGIQTLTGVNTYAGATTIRKGELAVNGSIATSSLLTVETGGILSGIGTVGTVSVLAGGSISPGNSVGTLAATSVDLKPGSIYAVEITAAATADKLAATGALTANGTIKVTLSGYAPVLGNVFDIADGTISGTPAFDFSSAVLGAGLGWDTSSFATDGTIKVGPSDDPYTAWATLNNVTEGKAGDDDKDGASNLLEFATNSDAKSNSSGARVYGKVHNDILTYTVATRKSAAFAAAGVRQKATKDKVVYTVEASDELALWNTVVVTELNAADSAAVQASLTLPTLDADWEWHSFRTDDTIAVDNRDWIRLAVAPE